ncbi:coatamer subunit protein [Seiridium cupressi]
MSSSKKVVESFPDVEAKLQKAQKQSAFDKERADREAKRKREAAETAAVYESFVKSFDNEDDEDDEISAIARGGQGPPSNRSQGPARGAFMPIAGPGRRHFGTGLKSGPGSLGPAPNSYARSGPGSLGPSPSNHGRRRGPDDGFRRDTDSRGRLGRYGDEREYDSPSSKGIPKAFSTSDDEADGRSSERAEERAVAKPTLRLANLPPGTSPAVIKALIPSNLAVENVKILPPAVQVSNERKSMTAIVILSPDTPATDIDTAVSSLQNRYLGFGFHLSLHRHLSSAVASTTATSSLASTASSHPFGAKPVAQPNDQNPYQQTQFHRGFAPPTSYGLPGGPVSRAGLFHVPIQAPRDIKQLQLIHKVIESVLEHGPEFEALLMSRPDVQREERWSWLWDARSEGGVWYRWRLWEVITGVRGQGGKPGKYMPLFEGSHAWKTPEKPLSYEYATNIDEFVSDSEYNSSDEDDFEDDGNKPGDNAPSGEGENAYLNPLDKAKLVHLLARLPSALSRIRKGDIARVTTFAITHASRGADEIVDLIVANIQKPLGFTSANPEHKQNTHTDQDGGSKGVEIDQSTPVPDDKERATNNELLDTGAASLVGVYVVSDILSSSATSGVRHSWRFRQLFESALRERKVFEHLGQTAERLNWGRLRADKWKRSVGLILSLWEGWCVFPAESQEHFVKSFEHPPSLAAKNNTESNQAANDEESEKKAGGRWKTVEAGNAEASKGFKPVSIDSGAGYDPAAEKMDVDDEMDEEALDEDLDDDVLMDSDIDGKPMSEDEEELDGDPMEEETPNPPVPEATAAPPSPQRQLQDSSKSIPDAQDKSERPVRRRMRAVDLFADDKTEKPTNLFVGTSRQSRLLLMCCALIAFVSARTDAMDTSVYEEPIVLMQSRTVSGAGARAPERANVICSRVR